ncbi:MAG: molybdenum cofactor guanylyltransferase MobA [Giesbergeria sp.]
MIEPQDITGLILAGGRGSRMGGVDKGLEPFLGVPLALHALLRLQPQVGTAMLNANRNLDIYRKFGVPVWTDADTDYAGPLSGFVTGLAHCATPWLLTVPCDTPLFPTDLAKRLAAAAEREQADIAMATAPETGRDGTKRLWPQPVFCLLRAGLLHSLQEFTQGGGRKIDTWTGQQRRTTVPFDAPGDDPSAFFNANTLAELHALESRGQLLAPHAHP